MTTSQPISPHQRPLLKSEIRLNRSLPSKHLELLSEDLSQGNDEGNLAGSCGNSSESDDHPYRRRNHDNEGSPA